MKLHRASLLLLLLLPLVLAGCGDSRSVRRGREAMAKERYASAIHYFEQALRRDPDQKDALELQKLIFQCKSSLADMEALTDEKLLAEVFFLKAENDRIRKENEELRATGASTPGTTIPPDVVKKAAKAEARAEAVKVAPPQAQPAAKKAEPATYTVKPGDTFGGIAKQFYGSPGKWRTILDANRDKVKDERSLRAGITLVIPQEP